jgi:hypothetical protein
MTVGCGWPFIGLAKLFNGEIKLTGLNLAKKGLEVKGNV